MPYTRFTRLNQELKKHQLDAFLITNPINIFYLTGFKAEDSLLLATPRKYFFITDTRFKEEGEKIFLPYKNKIEIKIVLGKKSKLVLIKEIIAGLKFKKVGFEAKSLSFFHYQKLKQGLSKKTNLVAVPGLVEGLRLIKDKEEIKLITRATRIAQSTFLYLKRIIKPGKKVTDLAREAEHFIRQQGGSGAAFDLIIAPGKESSKPHALLSSQTVKENQVVLVDLGVTFKGYNSDLTRTFFFGKIPSNLKRIKEIVIQAQRRSIKAIRAGVEISLLDKLARDYITDNGYRDNFLHSLGHGIGLQVHEDPTVAGFNREKLKAGMVFTVEPAIYLPGYAGIRIEDMVLVTNKGCLILSDDLDQSI